MSPAGAHEFWLSPSSYAAGPGDTLSVGALAGTGFRGDPVPYSTSRVLRFELIGPRRLDLRPAGEDGAYDFAHWVAADGGGAMMAYESGFRPIVLPAAKFDRYLEDEGLDAPRAARAKLGDSAGPGRERYTRCAKTWIAGADRRAGAAAGARSDRAGIDRTRVANSTHAAERATTPLGLRFELVPDRAPSAPGDRLIVQALFSGEPLAGALVRVWRRPTAGAWSPFLPAARDSVPPSGEARTDSTGRATLVVQGAGEWLVNAVHMVPSAEPTEADWDSYWASLTFAKK